MLEKLDEDAREALHRASGSARRRHRALGTADLLWALSTPVSAVAEPLRFHGLDWDEPVVSHALTHADERTSEARFGDTPLTTELLAVLALALAESHAIGGETIDEADLLLGLLRHGDGATRTILSGGLGSPSALRSAVERPSPFGERLGQAARDGELPSALNRDGVIDRLVQILSLRSKNNPVLIGEAGVGKRSVLNGLAQRVAAGRVPPRLRDRELILIDRHDLITNLTGSFEGRLRAVFEGAAKASTVLLCVNDADRYLDLSPRSEPGSVASVFWSLVGRGDLQVVLGMPPDVYRRHASRGSTLDTHCRPIPVPELSVDETRPILHSLRGTYEAHHGVKFASGVIDTVAELAERFLTEGHLPGKAVDLLDEVGAGRRSRAVFTPGEDDRTVLTTAEDVLRTLSSLTGIPATEITLAEEAERPVRKGSQPTTRLPHHATSTVLLLGTGAYDDPALPDIPAVANNLADLAAVLTGTSGGFDPARVHRHLDLSITDLPRIAEAAESAADTLLVYFAGHGFVESDGDLYLGLQATELPRRKHSALPYERLRDLVRDSPARNRVVILDCCYAGRAVGTLAEDGDPGGQLDIAGTYILAATSPTRRAHAPAGERHSAFTGALLSLLRQGIDNGDALIRIAQLFPHLRTALVARGLPAPQQRGTDTVGDLALTRNPRAVDSAG